MRAITLLMMFLFATMPVSAQVPNKRAMQEQMNSAVKEIENSIKKLETQIAEAKKNNEDAESIRDLEKQASMLKKQLAMMEGVNNRVATISEKTFTQAANEKKNKNSLPEKDSARIRSIPKKVLNEAEVLSLVKKIHIGVEEIISPAEKADAISIYTETKATYKTVTEINNAASGCWIYGHWEKALWLAGKASMEDMNDPDILNNYAAFLTMVGAEHAAIPLLQYLHSKYPKNSTVLNNIGQAWYGLGDISNATKFLDEATRLYPNHAMANLTLSRIYKAQGNGARSIAAMQRSIRGTYTPAKEAEMGELGRELDDDDLEFEYPMDEDPFGMEAFFNEFPPVPGSVSETPDAWAKWDAFREAVNELSERTSAEAQAAGDRGRIFSNNMADSRYNQPVLNSHNSNAYKTAGRKFPLAINKKSALTIVDVMNMMANKFHELTTERLNALEERRRRESSQSIGDCTAIDAINNRFMSDAKVIIDEGRRAMRQVYLQNKKKIHKFITLAAYASLSDYNQRMEQFHNEIWQKNAWIYTYQAGFVRSYGQLMKQPPMMSSCSDTRTEYPKQTKQLPELKIPNCTYTDGAKLCIGEIKERCNTCSVDESKIKLRQNDTQKGEVMITDSSNRSQGPQKSESTDPSKVKTMTCRQTGYVKVDKGRARRGEIRCTTNSEGNSQPPPGIRGQFGRLAR